MNDAAQKVLVPDGLHHEPNVGQRTESGRPPTERGAPLADLRFHFRRAWLTFLSVSGVGTDDDRQ